MPEDRLDLIQEQQLSSETRERIIEVVTQLKGLKSSIVANFLRMGDLLLEVKQNNYHIISGYQDFETWLDDARLGMRISEAYYMMRVVSKARAVGIERSQLELCDVSALKEIAVLNPDTQAEEIKELVQYASEHTTKEVKQRVNDVRAANGQDIFVLKGYRVSQTVWDEVIGPAIQRIKLEFGQTINAETGEIEDISDGRAYELLAAEYLSGS